MSRKLDSYPGTPKNFQTTYIGYIGYRAHRAVIFAIAWHLVALLHAVNSKQCTAVTAVSRDVFTNGECPSVYSVMCMHY